MTTNLTMSEILAKIKIYKNNLEAKYTDFLNPESTTAQNSKLLMTLYYPDRETTIRGVPTDMYAKEIQSNYDSIKSILDNYIKLIIIKNTVNSESSIIVHDIKLSVTSALLLKAPHIKNYYLGIIDKFKRDKSDIYKKLEEHEDACMSNENINRYVNAKIVSLNMENNYDMMQSNYEKFSKEYRDANKIAIFDPLNILDKMDDFEEKILDFYNSIDYKLQEFNSSTRIWIDFDKDIKDDFWGYL